MKRNLSGIYYKSKNPETGKIENVCFEELPEDEQDLTLANSHITTVRAIAKQLAMILKAIGEDYDIVNGAQ